MSLPPPKAPRHFMHERRITAQGYAREDMLWDIEAHLTDVKGYEFPNEWRGNIKPGEPVHGMWLRVTLDDSFKIHDVEAVTEYSPFSICGDVTPNFKELIGHSIGPGWRRKVKEMLGGTRGCTHLVEMLGTIATVAYQTVLVGRRQRDRMIGIESDGGEAAKTRQTALLNSCYAWAEDSTVVQRFMPEVYEDIMGAKAAKAAKGADKAGGKSGEKASD